MKPKLLYHLRNAANKIKIQESRKYSLRSKLHIFPVLAKYITNNWEITCFWYNMKMGKDGLAVIDFKEEVKKYRPVPSVDDVESVVNHEVKEMMDLLQYIGQFNQIVQQSQGNPTGRRKASADQPVVQSTDAPDYEPYEPYDAYNLSAYDYDAPPKKER